jgi:integrase
MARGDWTDPERGKIVLGDYAARWIEQRAGLRPRTVEIYRGLLRRHIVPFLGNVAISKIDTAMVREWRMALLAEGASASEAAKAYRFLRAVLMTAVDDLIIARNPCRIRGAGEEKPDERPVLTVSQVLDLADRVQDRRFRALVLLAAFAGLRWGEVTALRRCDIDIDAGTVTVQRQHVQLDTGVLIVGPPKSRAGIRTIVMPAVIVPEIREHLAGYTGKDQDALVFTGARGGALRRSNFRRAVKWTEAVEAIGAPDLHFHDLRHTGNTLAASTRPSLRDLMARMGHDSVRAALVYQHKTLEADRAIAAALSARIEVSRQADSGADGSGGPGDSDG